jgi:hypothetical protein
MQTLFLKSRDLKMLKTVGFTMTRLLEGQEIFVKGNEYKGYEAFGSNGKKESVNVAIDCEDEKSSYTVQD